MNIETVKVKKEAIEREITDIVKEFEAETGIEVDFIGVYQDWNTKEKKVRMKLTIGG